MTTMTRATNKDLTKKQYEFYKRKGMSDEKVMKLHDYNNATFNAWKKSHDLIGVKFESDLKVSQGITTSSSVDSKPEVVKVETVFNPEINEDESKMIHNTQETHTEHRESDETPTHKQIPTEYLGRATETLNDEYEGALSVGRPQTDKIPLNPINYIDLTAVENEELKAEIIALEERHVKDGDELNQMRDKYQAEKAHNVRHCDELVMERRKNKELDADNRNLLAQIKRQDELLIAADRKRKLLFEMMELAVEQEKRIQIAVEGGDF